MTTKSDFIKAAQGTKQRSAKTLIVYKSKYGSTEQYAKWINSKIKSDLVQVDDINKQNFENYELIIFGGYFRIGKIKIAPFIIKNWDVLKDKKIILFTTSATPPNHKFIKKTYESTFPESMRKLIKYFPLWED